MINCLYASTDGEWASTPLRRLDREALDPPEVAAVVREYGEAVPQRGRPDEQVKISNEVALGAQPPAPSAEDPTDFLINLQEVDPLQKGLYFLFTALRIEGPEHALVEFSQRDDAHSEPARGQFRDAVDDRANSVEVVNHPVRVHEVLHGAADPAARANR